VYRRREGRLITSQPDKGYGLLRASVERSLSEVIRNASCSLSTYPSASLIPIMTTRGCEFRLFRDVFSLRARGN